MLDSENGIFCTADTTAGRIQGIVSGGIRQFKAVPYGASTAGANRFRAPRKPAPWTGTRECFGYGPVSPQVPTDLTNSYGQLIQYDVAVAEGGIGEDCLHLNLWTPGLRDGAKRPVIVSIHGGGYAISSGNGRMYDGAELARQGDVVVVTVTHRLSSFAYLNLEDVGGGEEAAAASNAGIMDLVLALEWVRDNIEGFGGDPNRVLIFGQSGGGWKVSTLLATPAAKGLFHRAGVQSGSQLRLLTREQSAAMASALIAEIGLTKATLGRIREVPWQILLAAQAKMGALNFSPTLDGQFLPHHPFDPKAPDESADIPLIISTTLDDAGLFFADFDLDEAGLKAELQNRFGEVARPMLRLYRECWPTKSPFLVHAQLMTDYGFRRYAYAQAERKAAQGRAPVYLYQWDWATDAFDGRWGAAHATDVSASFGNSRDTIMGGGRAAGRKLCDALVAMWTAFAATGDPNNPRMPHWPAFEPQGRATMIFNNAIRVVNDPNRELRLFWETQPPANSVYD